MGENVIQEKSYNLALHMIKPGGERNVLLALSVKRFRTHRRREFGGFDFIDNRSDENTRSHRQKFAITVILNFTFLILNCSCDLITTEGLRRKSNDECKMKN